MNRRGLFDTLGDLVDVTKARRTAYEGGEFATIEDVDPTGMTWYEWATADRIGVRPDGTRKVLRWLPKSKPPKGENVTDPQVGVAYRGALDPKKGHLLDPRSPEDDPWFLCGLGVWPDHEWWLASGGEDRLGTFLVEDTRKGGRCGPCSTAWKKLQKDGRTERPKTLSSVSDEEWTTVRPMFLLEAMKLDRAATMVAMAFNGRIEDGVRSNA